MSSRMLIAAMLVFGLGISSRASAQNLEQSAAYVSPIDEDLTIRKIGILTVSDNVDGIYARPTERQLTDLIKAQHRWDFVEGSPNDGSTSVLNLEESPGDVQRLTSAFNADAFIAATINRASTGVSIRLNLFTKKDGKLLAQEILRDQPRTDLAEVRSLVAGMYKNLIAKIPYDGFIISRQQNRITLNIGKDDGIKKDQVLTVVQIVAATRHPKFNFLISTDKEILGRIKILKVDDTLSFGAIISEKERGAIRKFAKVSGLNPVNYPDPGKLEPGADVTDMNSRSDANVALGSNPREWKPPAPPSFGQVGGKLGLGSYEGSINLGSTGTFESRDSVYPSVNLFGEIWLTSDWTVRADYSQAVIASDNPRDGSSPAELNQSMSRYSLEVTRSILLRDDFFGPKFGISAGLGGYRLYVDDSSPRSLTTVSYAGLYLGISGLFPVTDDKIWYAGGKLNVFILPGLTEKPVKSGGDSSNSITDFSFIVERRLGQNLRLIGSADFSLYSTNFSGRGTRVDVNGNPEVATSLSQRHTSFSAGIAYLF